MDAGQFLRELWGDPPPGQVLVWMLPQKRSAWYFKLDGVAAQLEGYADRDIYTGVGIAAPDAKVTSATRVTSVNVAGIPGLWADIDVAGPVHKKPNLPPTEEDARGLLGKLPFAPTILVHSGHGLQGWWLFEEPWIFQSEEERYQAQALARWWHGKLAALFEERGWTLDATHDLARVMRLPGTYNNKAKRVPVTVLSSDGPRVSVQELLDLVPMTQEKVVEQICMPLVGEIALSADASPPFEKFMALMENDQKFKRSWNRHRPDLPDQSASSYDMSLASISVAANWSDQEVADLLIASRRSQGDAPKLRSDYYHRTIARAKGPKELAEAQERLDELMEGDHEDAREGMLETLSKLWGIEIRCFIRWSSNDGAPSFDLEIKDAETVHFDSVASITNQKSFRDRVLAATGIVLPRSKSPRWDKQLQALFNAVEDRDTGDETSPESYCFRLLSQYLDYSSSGADSREKGLAQRKHWVEDGNRYFFIDSFLKWVSVQHNMRYSAKEIGTMLKKQDGVNERSNTQTKDGRHTTVSVWKLPT